MMESNNNERVVEKWAQTEQKVSNLQFTWTIDKFSFYKECEVCVRIESPTFSMDGDNEIKWRLILYPHSNAMDHYCAIHLIILSEPCDKSKMTGKFTIAILKSDFKKAEEETINISSLKLNKPVGSPKYVLRSTIFTYPTIFLPGDKLNILCKISFVTDSISFSCQKSTAQIKVPDSKITDDLANLVGSRKFSDITLVVDRHEFPAHKAILAVRSNVFAAMFEHDMEELKTGRVNITDLSREVLQEMLNFIYTEKAPNLKKLAKHLLVAADKYALEKLKAMSEKALFDQLSQETAIDTLVLADLHSASQLKQQALNFIKTHSKNILKTKEWQNMKTSNDHSSLIADILEALMLN